MEILIGFCWYLCHYIIDFHVFPLSNQHSFTITVCFCGSHIQTFQWWSLEAVFFDSQISRHHSWNLLISIYFILIVSIQYLWFWPSKSAFKCRNHLESIGLWSGMGTNYGDSRHQIWIGIYWSSYIISRPHNRTEFYLNEWTGFILFRAAISDYKAIGIYSLDTRMVAKYEIVAYRTLKDLDFILSEQYMYQYLSGFYYFGII